MPPACRVLRSVCGHVVASAGASADVETQVETELIVKAVSGALLQLSVLSRSAAPGLAGSHARRRAAAASNFRLFAL